MIALLAHDARKKRLLKFVMANLNFFKGRSLVATDATAEILRKHGLEVQSVPHGPLGGDIEIASLVIKGGIEAVFFLRDVMEVQAHEPDVMTLVRICTIYDVPLALNIATAECIVECQITTPAPPSIGATCPKCRLRKLVIVKSVTKGKNRIRYIGCKKCGFRPPGNKLVIPDQPHFHRKSQDGSN